MKKLKTVLILLFVSLLSCKQETKKNTIVNVDSNISESILLDQLADEIEIISLKHKDSIYWGNIEQVKSYGDLLFFHDQFQTKSITVYNSKGEFVSQLKNRGRGPGQYNGIDAFTYNEKKKQLTIYDRGSKLITYCFPNLQAIQTIDCQDYFMNIELLDNKLLVVGENEKSENEYFGLEFYDCKENTYQSLNLPNNPATIELSYPNTFTKQKGRILYASQGFLTKLFEIRSKKTNQLYSIDFGRNKIPEEYWQYKDANMFEEALSKKNSATWVQSVILNRSLLSFYYMYEDIDTFYLAKYDLNTKLTKVYSSIYLQEGYASLGRPIGVSGNYYLFLLYPENIGEYLNLDTKNGQKKWQEKLIKYGKEKNPILLKIKL